MINREAERFYFSPTQFNSINDYFISWISRDSDLKHLLNGILFVIFIIILLSGWRGSAHPSHAQQNHYVFSRCWWMVGWLVAWYDVCMFAAFDHNIISSIDREPLHFSIHGAMILKTNTSTNWLIPFRLITSSVCVVWCVIYGHRERT